MGVCNRILIVSINGMFFLFGVALLVGNHFSKWVLKDVAIIQKVKSLYNVSLVLLVISAIIIAISFLGCYGGLMKNRCLLQIYIMILIILLICQITCTILIYIRKSDLKNIVSEALEIQFFSRNQSDYRGSIDKMQKSYKCCGMHNYTDFHGMVPKSCCIVGGCNTTNSETLFKKGCYEKIKDKAEKFVKLSALFSLLTCILEFMLSISTCIFQQNI